MILLALACASDFDREQWGVPDHFPDPWVPERNPMTPEKAELGRYLFFDFSLSVNGTRSCGVCHEASKGFTDGFARAVGATDELHSRNTLTVTDVLWREDLGWRTRTLPTLEEQLYVPLQGLDPLEMGMTDALVEERLQNAEVYAPLFDAAFPGQPISMDHVALALATFQRTLISGRTPYDAFLAGEAELPADAERGRLLFFGRQANCSRCHGGVFLDSPTDGLGRVTARHGWFNTGLYNTDGAGAYPDSEQGLIEETGLPGDMGRFRTPSLRNVARTGPWTHDGSVGSLESLLDAYARGGRHVQSGPNPGDGATNPFKHELVSGFEMTERDRADLVAFLNALTDEQMLEDPFFQTPWCLTVGGEVVNAPCEPAIEVPEGR